MLSLRESKPEWFDENGNLLSFDQRRALDSAKSKAAQLVSAELERRQAREVSHSDRILSATQQRIADLQDKLKYCLSTDREGIQRKISMYKSELAKLEADMKAEAKQQAFANSPDVARARENAEALARSWRETYPHADESGILLAVEIARSEQWETPEALRQAYWRQVEIVADQNASAERNAATLASEAKLKSELHEANAQVRLLEAERNLQEVRGQQ